MDYVRAHDGTSETASVISARPAALAAPAMLSADVAAFRAL